MAQTRQLCDVALYLRHQGACRCAAAAGPHEHRGGAALEDADAHGVDLLAPPTREEECGAEEAERIAALHAATLAQEETTRDARAQAAADRALLREHGPRHHDPVVQAAARLLAR